MTKRRLNLRKAAITACLAVVALFAGCLQSSASAIYSSKAMDELTADLKKIAETYKIEQVRIFEEDKLSNDFEMAVGEEIKDADIQPIDGTCGVNLVWNLFDGKLTISGTGAMENYATSNLSPFYIHRDKIISVVIEVGVTNIGQRAFSQCSVLTSISIPNSVQSIEYAAFANCSNLTVIDIPKNLQSIGLQAFYACSNLASITIPKSVQSIGRQAFVHCSSLKDIYLQQDIPLKTEADIFIGIDMSNCVLHVPVGSKALYVDAKVWKEFVNIVEDISLK